MGLWDGIVKRGITGEVRKEDIHKAYAKVEMGPAQKYSSFLIDKKEYKMEDEIMKSVRFHDVKVKLMDERFKHYCQWSSFIITKIGDTGLTTVQGMIDKVVSVNGDFDGYTCEEDNSDTWKFRTDKTNRMLDELKRMIQEYNLEMGGFKEVDIKFEVVETKEKNDRCNISKVVFDFGCCKEEAEVLTLKTSDPIKCIEDKLADFLNRFGGLHQIEGHLTPKSQNLVRWFISRL